MYKVQVQKRAVKALRKLSPENLALANELIGGLETDPYANGKKLHGVPKGRPPLYRKKAGNVRIVYAVFENEITVVVALAGDRKNVYQARLKDLQLDLP